MPVPCDKSETDESEIQDELPDAVHAEDYDKEPDVPDSCVPDPTIGWANEYQSSFYARLGERLHGICARHTVSDKCGAEIWGLMKSLFQESDAAKMKGFKAVKQRNFSVLPKLFVDTHYMDAKGKKHVIRNLPKYPRKFIESNKMVLQTVVTRYRLPDVLRVIELIHETMDKQGEQGDEPDSDDDDWVAQHGRPIFALDHYKKGTADPGEASNILVQLPDDPDANEGKSNLSYFTQLVKNLLSQVLAQLS